MLVQPIVPADHAAVSEIARASGAELDIDAELGRGWSRLWVARPTLDVAAVAFLLAWDVADELHVINVATHPDQRRRGAARALMGTLLSHARTRHARLVLLEVRRSNYAAIRLYRAHGFSVMGLRRGYYAEMDQRAKAQRSEDAVEMMIELDPATGRAVARGDEIQLGLLDEASTTPSELRPFSRRG